MNLTFGEDHAKANATVHFPFGSTHAEADTAAQFASPADDGNVAPFSKFSRSNSPS